MHPEVLYHPPDPALPSFRTSHRRPHIYPGGGTLAVTMRLAGSVTRPTIRRVQAAQLRHGNRIPPDVYWGATAEERRAFRLYASGQTTRRDLNGPFHFDHRPEIRDFVMEALLEEERRGGWEILAASLMPNHAHLLLRHTHLKRHMGTVLRLWKSYTARRCNQLLGASGSPFWEHENYDSYVDSPTALLRHLEYTLHNPVAGALCNSWMEWPGNYCAPRLRRAVNSRPRLAG